MQHVHETGNPVAGLWLPGWLLGCPQPGTNEKDEKNFPVMNTAPSRMIRQPNLDIAQQGQLGLHRWYSAPVPASVAIMAAVKEAIQPVSSRLPEMKDEKQIAAMLKGAKTRMPSTENIEASTAIVLVNQTPSRPSTRNGSPPRPVVLLRGAFAHTLECQVLSVHSVSQPPHRRWEISQELG